MIVLGVLEGLKVIAEAIENVRAVVTAIRDGRDYMKSEPTVRADLVALVQELRKTILLVIEASSLLTQFRFAAGGNDPTSETVRFNEHMMKQTEREQELRTQIEDLRTHCHKVREHAQAAMNKVKVSGFGALFSKLGVIKPTEQAALANQLDHLAYEDHAAAHAWEQILDVVAKSLAAIQDALCENGTMTATKLPEAAALLAEYRAVVQPIEQQARTTAAAIAAAVTDLQGT